MSRHLRLILETMKNRRVIERIHDDLDRVKDRIKNLIENGIIRADINRLTALCSLFSLSG